jgi:hypothetical protein
MYGGSDACMDFEWCEVSGEGIRDSVKHVSEPSPDLTVE